MICGRCNATQDNRGNCINIPKRGLHSLSHDEVILCDRCYKEWIDIALGSYDLEHSSGNERLEIWLRLWTKFFSLKSKEVVVFT